MVSVLHQVQIKEDFLLLINHLFRKTTKLKSQLTFSVNHMSHNAQQFPDLKMVHF